MLTFTRLHEPPSAQAAVAQLTLPASTRLTTSQLTALLVSGADYGGLAYATPRANFWQLLLLFASAFGAYSWLLRYPLSRRTGLLAALLLRLLWLPALPNLSNDYHRFRWDGALVAQGRNPYGNTPAALINAQAQQPGSASQRLIADSRLYSQLNSPQYYSVYPPLCQAVFGLAAHFFPDSERGAVVVMRLVLLAAEAGTAWLLLALLPQFGLSQERAQWYLLNPLVVVELTGNLHFEGLAIFLLLAALWLLERGQLVLSAGALAGAAATKLLPLLMLPLLLRRLGWRQFWPYATITGFLFAASFGPFFSSSLLHNISRGLALYFHQFEFNAGVYYLLRALGYWLTGYNQMAYLGPSLAVVVAIALLLLTTRQRRLNLAELPRTLLLALTLFYLLATVVQPWYLTPLVALSIFTRYRYMLAWSGLVVLSYAAYQTSVYTENLWLVGLEYAGLLTAFNLDLLESYTNYIPLPPIEVAN